MSTERSTTRSCDVLVIGYGGAGAAAAIEAHDRGARVLILEKGPEGGGNTRDSGGSLRRLTSAEGALEHFLAVTQGVTPVDVLESFVTGVEPMLDWLESIGAELKPWKGIGGFQNSRANSAYPNLPGADALGARLRVEGPPDTGGGQSLWNVLEAAVRSREIPVLLNTPAIRLLREPEGRVTGALVDAGSDGTFEIHAARGVILASGGFSYGHELQRQFLGLELPAFGPPGENEGDGIRMAQAIGAGLWHMNAAAAVFGYVVTGMDAAYQHRMPSGGFVYLDRYGRRYVNEGGFDNHSLTKIVLQLDPVRAEYPRIPTWVVFDETTRASGPICHVLGGYNRRFRWSQDNRAEIERGWITQADHLPALAREIGVSAEELTDSIERFNEFCGDGEDRDFGREPSSMVPIIRPPFYAIAVQPCLLNTQGGPRRDARARILDAFDEPIEGLYGAGELGSIWGALYPGGANVSEALIFGRIAGAEATNRQTL